MLGERPTSPLPLAPRLQARTCTPANPSSVMQRRSSCFASFGVCIGIVPSAVGSAGGLSDVDGDGGPPTEGERATHRQSASGFA